MSRGVAFVLYDREESAKIAMESLDDTVCLIWYQTIGKINLNILFCVPFFIIMCKIIYIYYLIENFPFKWIKPVNHVNQKPFDNLTLATLTLAANYTP